jgi:hypothetical protein
MLQGIVSIYTGTETITKLYLNYKAQSQLQSSISITKLYLNYKALSQLQSSISISKLYLNYKALPQSGAPIWCLFTGYIVLFAQLRGPHWPWPRPKSFPKSPLDMLSWSLVALSGTSFKVLLLSSSLHGWTVSYDCRLDGASECEYAVKFIL